LDNEVFNIIDARCNHEVHSVQTLLREYRTITSAFQYVRTYTNTW